jgi:hypothetical protein
VEWGKTLAEYLVHTSREALRLRSIPEMVNERGQAAQFDREFGLYLPGCP